jgi:ATP-dependent helicase HrpB
VQDAELFLCLQVSGEYQGDALARIVSAVEPQWLVGPSLQDKDELLYHPSQKQVVARRRRYWNDLLIQETPIAAEDTEAVADLLFQHATAEFDVLFPKDDEVIGGWLARVRCLHQWMPELQLPAFDRSSILEVLKTLCYGRRSLAELRSAPWREALESALTGEQLNALQKHAPERMQLPKGHRVKVAYEEGKPPVLAARIQDFFGWSETPRIAGGKVRLQLHLLAPNQRCQQITEDLASFWKNTYETVRKELKRRYPKHSWPENPLVVEASDGAGGGTKPRK